MSEQGWRDFLAADGVEDWVVLHGGATAVFRVGSLAHATQVAAAMAQLPGLDWEAVVLTARDETLTVRLTRDLWSIDREHIRAAQQIAQCARECGAQPDRSTVQEVQVAVAAKPDDIDVHFWRAALGYHEGAADNAVDPLGHGSTVWMQELDQDRQLRHAMHIDVSVPREEAERRVAAAIAAGGRVVHDAEAPATWILSDRAGNRVCIASWPDGAVPPESDGGE